MVQVRAVQNWQRARAGEGLGLPDWGEDTLMVLSVRNRQSNAR